MSAQPRKPHPSWGQGSGRRDHPTGDVVDGQKIVGNAKVNIAAFNPEHSPKMAQEIPRHDSTSPSQKAGDTARGFANDSGRFPSDPVAAFNPQGKVTPAPALTWGMSSAPREHRAQDAADVLRQAEDDSATTIIAPHSARDCGD